MRADAHRRWRHSCVLCVTAMLTVALAATSVTAQEPGTEDGEWRYQSGDAGGTRFSPLDQIDASNFSDLEVAWEWLSVDTFVSRTTPGGGEWWAPLDAIVDTLVEDTPDLYRVGHPPNPSGFQATPLMIGGVLYFNTPLSQGVAVDAVTGETLWVFNPKSYEEGTTTMTGTWRQRGVAYWTDGEAERVLLVTGTQQLVSIDAKTGQPDLDFGEGGIVDTVIYGLSNDDGLVDDSGGIATTVAPPPGSDEVLFRYPDGADSDDHGEDWKICSTPSPGAANGECSTGGGNGGEAPGGCGCRNEDLPEGEDPSNSCATTGPIGGLEWLLLALVAWRRRED